jgi:hypothetical protein
MKLKAKAQVEPGFSEVRSSHLIRRQRLGSEAGPNGIDSIRATDATMFELLDPFYQQFGTKPGS